MRQDDPHYEPERIARELDWNLLRTFVVLAESHSVTDAASQLRLKQPSVSTALKRLEDRVWAQVDQPLSWLLCPHRSGTFVVP